TRVGKTVDSPQIAMQFLLALQDSEVRYEEGTRRNGGPGLRGRRRRCVWERRQGEGASRANGGRPRGESGGSGESRETGQNRQRQTRRRERHVRDRDDDEDAQIHPGSERREERIQVPFGDVVG